MRCPDCLWESPETAYRGKNDGRLIIPIPCQQVSENPQYYPLILECHTTWKGTFEWREVHKCPRCLREFEQTLQGITAPTH